jgi:lysophospholipase L1-like esterase
MMSLKNYLWYGCLLFCAVLPVNGYAKQKNTKPVVVRVKDFNSRDGLPNFYHKLQQNRSVHIAYLGGSITAAQDGWRELTCNWFRVTWPQTIITHNNAAIGGTGSNLGVFRTERDVIRYKPDLVFVEFAVNDGGKEREKVVKPMEGIVRKIWLASPETDICFVYTIDQDKMKKLQEGHVDPAAEAMEEVAEHYGIPSIHLGYDVMRLLQEGKLVFTAPKEENKYKIVFTSDNVHPLSESGHPLYAATITRRLSEIAGYAVKKPHVLPDPIFEDCWEKGTVVSMETINKDATWEALPAGHPTMQIYNRFFDRLYKGKAGSRFSFRFKGTVIGLYDFVGPKSPILNVTIDGEKKEVMRFDKHSSYGRMSYTILADNLKNGIHQADIEVSGKPIDKAEVFKSAPANLEKLQASPELFDGIEYTIGGLLIVGELEKE